MEYSQVQKELRENLVREAREAVLQLQEEDGVQAAILTGSAAWGKPNPDGDLDILIITQGQEGVLYRYLIPGFCAVRIRTELGFIPHENVIRNFEERYATPISCSMIEQLKNGRVLFQKESRGDAVIESARQVAPGRLLIGKLISSLDKALRQLHEHLDQDRFEEVLLGTRQAARSAVQVLLLARDRTGVAKEKHEYRAVRKSLSQREVKSYERLTGVEEVTAEDAQRLVAKTIDLMKWVLEKRSISTDLVDYNGRTTEAKGGAS